MEEHCPSEANEQTKNQNDKNEITHETASPETSRKFWNNDVIWRELTSYLNISDLKDLSCVNPYFLFKVRGINRFTCLAGQIVTGKMEIRVFKLSRAIVLVNQLDANTLQERAAEIFQDTEYLEIHCLSNLSDTDRNSRLIQIITNCPKLKSLAFAKYNFLGKKIESFLKDSDVKLILSKLKELHLEVDKRCFSYKEKQEWEYSVKKSEISSDPFQSFKFLSDVQLSLVKFTYEASQLKNYVTCFFSPESVLSSSKNFLVELNLRVPFGSTLSLQNMKFPNLEKFSLKYSNALNFTKETFNQQVFDANFAIFVKNHLPSLTHFELDSPEFAISFTGVCDVLKCSKKIRVLVLGRHDQRSFNETEMNINEWDSLANISSLRSLAVCTNKQTDLQKNWQDYLNNYNRYSEILSPNANSFKFGVYNWYKDFSNPEYFTATVKSTFMNFQNLVELKLFAFLSDEILQFVCKHLTKLLIFEGDFSDVTDFGLSGTRKHDNYNSGISIANLKGLRRLHMYPKFTMRLDITWDGLLQSIHFFHLVDLRVMGDLKSNNSLMKPQLCPATQHNYLQLICKTRNPSLERVLLSFYKPDRKDRENIRKANPRLKFFSWWDRGTED